MPSDFVEGWTIVQTLGEGAFGEVQMVVNKVTGDPVAMKVLDFKKHQEARNSIRKEVVIHKMLRDPHIIQCYGMRLEEDVGYIFLEYASGGELFDKIEPDVGMALKEAQKYFNQLISGVEYMHRMGIAHRDLKPENLLLDDNDNLKISDFGMATVFRSKGKERALEKQCGTLPYIAPEVLQKRYRAEPADIWSCGIILVAMLAGELPWDHPSAECHEYKLWKSSQYSTHTPWSKIDNMPLSLLRRILVPNPANRYSVQKIIKHRWCCNENIQQLSSNNSSPPCKKLKTDTSPNSNSHNEVFSSSQPNPHGSDENDNANVAHDYDASYSFSQPTQVDDLLLSSQLLSTQSTQSYDFQNTFQQLVRRMTRFHVKVSVEEAHHYLIAALDKLHLTFKNNPTCGITIFTTDKRKAALVFKANIMDMDGLTLIDFRLSKGCGLEFKRYFVTLKKFLVDIVIKTKVSPISIPMCIN